MEIKYRYAWRSPIGVIGHGEPLRGSERKTARAVGVDTVEDQKRRNPEMKHWLEEFDGGTWKRCKEPEGSR